MLKRLGLEQPFVLETHGGRGRIYERLYSNFRGCVIELDRTKVEFLARQRATWAVYQGKAEDLLGAGMFRWWTIDFLDIDPFGEPWPTLEGFFSSQRRLAPRMALAVNYGLRQNARVKGAWKVNSTKAAAAKWGNDKVRAHYVEFCEGKLGAIVDAAGYRMDWFLGYYTGNLDDITHYGAVLEKKASPTMAGEAA